MYLDILEDNWMRILITVGIRTGVLINRFVKQYEPINDSR